VRQVKATSADASESTGKIKGKVEIVHTIAGAVTGMIKTMIKVEFKNEVEVKVKVKDRSEVKSEGKIDIGLTHCANLVIARKRTCFGVDPLQQSQQFCILTHTIVQRAVEMLEESIGVIEQAGSLQDHFAPAAVSNMLHGQQAR